MIGYRLCQTKMAEVPYYIENIGVNIYSMEELCYYIYHNYYLLDGTIINEGLLNWICEELNLKKLYHTLYKELEDFQSLGDFVLPIFKEIHYLTHQEFREFYGKLARLEHEPAISREKLKADYLVENKKYLNAIKVYDSILQQAKGSRLGGQFIGEVHHNKGCAFMRMFKYEEALECFREAYAALPEEHIVKAYLTAAYITKPYAYVGQLTEQIQTAVEQKAIKMTKSAALLLEEVEKEVQQMRERIPLKTDICDVDVFLEKIRKDYHNSTDH